MDTSTQQHSNDQFLQQLGRRIRQLRAITRNEMLKEFAQRIEINESYLCYIEYGKAVGLTVSVLKKIADGLGVELYDLVDVQQGDLKTLTNTDIELQRLFTRINALDQDQKKIVIGTLRGMVDGIINIKATEKKNVLAVDLARKKADYMKAGKRELARVNRKSA